MKSFAIKIDDSVVDRYTFSVRPNQNKTKIGTYNKTINFSEGIINSMWRYPKVYFMQVSRRIFNFDFDLHKAKQGALLWKNKFKKIFFHQSNEVI